jgi:WD40-like Beta Propeller Repeat
VSLSRCITSADGRSAREPQKCAIRQTGSGCCRKARAFVGAVIAAVLCGSCGGEPHQVDTRPRGGVAFLIGYSTDPYGRRTRPTAMGVATGLLGPHPRRVSRSFPRPPTRFAWLGRGRLVVGTANAYLRSSPATLVTFQGTRLNPVGAPPLRRTENTFLWSPGGRMIATQPSLRVSCGADARPGLVCTARSRFVFVERSDASGRHLVARGHLRGWTPDGRLVLFTGSDGQFAHGAFETIDLRSGRRAPLLSSRAVGELVRRTGSLGDLAYSADGRFLAALAAFGKFGLWGIVVARSDGHIVRVLRSRNLISMFAWSPHGHRLAYTTSGFPAPHELYVLASPLARARRILSQAPHFDWITWSPDGRWLLVDNEHLHAWELLKLTGRRRARLLGGASVPTRRIPRLGGMPLWCCPQNSYGGS